MVAAFFFHPALSSHFWSFVDNSAAQFAMTKGYTADDSVNHLTSLYWCFCANARLAPWFDRVPSKAQLADGVSRRDFSIPEAYSWQVLHVDFSPLYEFLLRVILDQSFFSWHDVQQIEVICEALRRQAGWSPASCSPGGSG